MSRTAYSLFLFLAVLLPLSSSFYIPDSNPLLSFGDQVREKHLYTENRRKGLFLEMTPHGNVLGSPARTAQSVLELRAVRPGEVVIKGVSSSLYLCVDSGGHLRGQRDHTDEDCTFKEKWLGDGYTAFFSSHHGLHVSLGKHSPEQHAYPFTRFLPLENTLAPGNGPVKSESPATQKQFHLDSHDLFNTGLRHIVSPQFSEDKKR